MSMSNKNERFVQLHSFIVLVVCMWTDLSKNALVCMGA